MAICLFQEYEQHNYAGILKTYKYPFDFSGTTSYQHMFDNHVTPAVYQKEEQILGDPYDPDETLLLTEQQTNYTEITASYGETVQVPESVLFKKGVTNSETKFRYTQYDTWGKLIEYKSENGVPHCIIWGYNGIRPFAKIDNISFSAIPSALLSAIQTASSPTGTQAGLTTALVNLRSNAALSGAMVTTMTYTPSGKLSTLTDEKATLHTIPMMGWIGC